MIGRVLTLGLMLVRIPQLLGALLFCFVQVYCFARAGQWLTAKYTSICSTCAFTTLAVAQRGLGWIAVWIDPVMSTAASLFRRLAGRRSIQGYQPVSVEGSDESIEVEEDEENAPLVPRRERTPARTLAGLRGGAIVRIGLVALLVPLLWRTRPAPRCVAGSRLYYCKHNSVIFLPDRRPRMVDARCDAVDAARLINLTNLTSLKPPEICNSSQV